MNLGEKQCSLCLTNYSFNYFYKDKYCKDGYSNRCKMCKNDYIKNKREENKEKNKNIELPLNKVCPSCNILKSSVLFTKLITSKDGLSVYCTDCSHLKEKKRRRQPKIDIGQNASKIKICFTCQKEKTFSNFRLNKKCNDSVSNICLECLPKNNWTKEKQQASEKKYRMNNPEKIKEKQKRRAKKVHYKLKSRISSRLRECLLANKLYKNNKTVEYLGCSITFFKGWIESQFQNEMTWENQGEWHLDHVKPCASFNLSDPNEFKICFNWKNYQPLWGKDNLAKHDSVDYKLIKNHLEKANNYENIFNNKPAQVKEGGLLEQP